MPKHSSALFRSCWNEIKAVHGVFFESQLQWTPDQSQPASPHSPTSPDSTIHVCSSVLCVNKMDVSEAFSADNTHDLGPNAQKQKKKRIRNWTAEDRAIHREFEKSRREAFSERLMVGHGSSSTQFHTF